MKDIDFLPDRYRVQTSARKARVWRLTVLLVFSMGVGATATGQLALRGSATARLQAIKLQHSNAQATSELQERLHSQLSSVEDSARLYAYLQHPWPRTQLLTTVVEILPPEISLNELRIVRETPPNVKRLRPSRRGGSQEEQDAKDRLPAVQQDLQQLQEERKSTRCVVYLKGFTSQLASLHAYQAKLSESTLITKVELISLESAKSESQSGTLQFGLRLVVLPGYGNPSGPVGADNDKPVTASNALGDTQR